MHISYLTWRVLQFSNRNLQGVEDFNLQVMALVHILLQHNQTSLETVVIEDSGRPGTCREEERRGVGRGKGRGGEGRKERDGREG